MTEPYPSDLFILCSRPDAGHGERDEIRRLAGTIRDWEGALGKAEREGLLPLLYWTLRNDPGAVPSTVLERLRLAFLANLARTVQVYRELEPFLEAVRRSGLRAALTKGGRLALDVYPDTALRPFWDVDFIVHPSDWAGLRRILVELGFVETSGASTVSFGATGPSLDWTFSPYFKKASLFLEFHANPLGLHMTTRGGDGFWTSAGRLRVRGTEAMVLPVENELCYLCVHVQQHSYQRLIWLADIVRLAGRAGLDWDWIYRFARDERIKGPVFYGLRLATSLWPGSVPPEQLARLRPGPLELAGLRLLWPESVTASRRDLEAWPYYMPSIFSLWERRDPVMASRVLGRIFLPPRAWLASATGVAVHSPRLFGRYIERLLRPAMTAARRLLDAP